MYVGCKLDLISQVSSHDKAFYALTKGRENCAYDTIFVSLVMPGGMGFTKGKILFFFVFLLVADKILKVVCDGPRHF